MLETRYLYTSQPNEQAQALYLKNLGGISAHASVNEKLDYAVAFTLSIFLDLIKSELPRTLLRSEKFVYSAFHLFRRYKFTEQILAKMGIIPMACLLELLTGDMPIGGRQRVLPILASSIGYYIAEKISDDFGEFPHIVELFSNVALDLLDESIDLDKARAYINRREDVELYDCELKKLIREMPLWIKGVFYFYAKDERTVFRSAFNRTLLKLNINALYQAYSAVRAPQDDQFSYIRDFTIQGLKSRYLGSRETIQKPYEQKNIYEAVSLRTQTILTNYTFGSMLLAICISDSTVVPNVQLHWELIKTTIELATTEIGLVNDVGSLLDLDEASLVMLLRNVPREVQHKQVFANIDRLKEYGIDIYAFARLIKDAQNHEPNIALDTGIHQKSIPMQWQQFISNLSVLGDISRGNRKRIMDNINKMYVLGVNYKVINLIVLFLEFNRGLYSHPESQGDYDRLFNPQNLLPLIHRIDAHTWKMFRIARDEPDSPS